MDIINQARNNVDKIEGLIAKLRIRQDIIDTMEVNNHEIKLTYVADDRYRKSIDVTSIDLKPGTLEAIKILILNDVKDSRDTTVSALLPYVEERGTNNGEY